jgi:DNA processing protein
MGGGWARRCARLRAAAGTLCAAVDSPETLTGLPRLKAWARELVGADLAGVHGEVERAEAAGWRLVTCGAEAYPRALSDLDDPPCALWIAGRGPADRAVAVVGTRRATRSGLANARGLAAGLAAAGLGVISGLARGIDGAAHRAALEAGGGTWGLLGSGLARPYPREHAGLVAEMVAAGGGVLSEYPPDTGPRREHFPARNRLIAALAAVVVVVEGAEQSGALITARLALELGRTVGAVPGPAGAALSAAPHQLLREGALLVESARDVLEEMGLTPPAVRLVHVAGRELAALAALSAGPLDAEEVSAACGWTVAAAVSVLGALVVQGLVREESGGLYSVEPGALPVEGA